MADRLVRPDWVRRVNLMAGSVGGHARDLVPIDAADMLDTAAIALRGLPAGDLGDPRWQERFEALAGAIDGSGMHVVGRLMTKQELLRSLRTRLLLTAAIDRAPSIRDQPVTAPVIVTGPARSGTTILFELLALDPALRAPTAAEALHPVALPESGGGVLPESGGGVLPESGGGVLPESGGVCPGPVVVLCPGPVAVLCPSPVAVLCPSPVAVLCPSPTVVLCPSRWC